MHYPPVRSFLRLTLVHCDPYARVPPLCPPPGSSAPVMFRRFSHRSVPCFVLRTTTMMMMTVRVRDPLPSRTKICISDRRTVTFTSAFASSTIQPYCRFPPTTARTLLLARKPSHRSVSPVSSPSVRAACLALPIYPITVRVRPFAAVTARLPSHCQCFRSDPRRTSALEELCSRRVSSPLQTASCTRLILLDSRVPGPFAHASRLASRCSRKKPLRLRQILPRKRHLSSRLPSFEPLRFPMPTYVSANARLPPPADSTSAKTRIPLPTTPVHERIRSFSSGYGFSAPRHHQPL
jgi:hypothetical protein